MGDFNHRTADTNRLLNLKPSQVDLREESSPNDGATEARRNSSVRFNDTVTTIADDVGESTLELARFRSGSTNHKWSLEAGDGHDKMGDGEQSRSFGESTAFYRWRTERRQREAALEQNLNWLREEIVKLKHQDQSLMRQFLQLRSVIYQLKGTVSSGQRPVVKLPKIAASMDSLVRYKSSPGIFGEAEDLSVAEEDEEEEEELSELDDQLGLIEDPYLPEFRGRTVSLLNPDDIGRGGDVAGSYGYLKTRTMSFSVGTTGREQDRAIIE